MTAKAPTPCPQWAKDNKPAPSPPPPPTRAQRAHREAVEVLDIAGRTLAEMAGCLAEMAEKIVAEARRLDPAP